MTTEEGIDTFVRDVRWITGSLIDDLGLELGVTVHAEWLQAHPRSLAHGLGDRVELAVLSVPPLTTTVLLLNANDEPVEVTLVAAGDLSYQDRGERPPSRQERQ